MTKEELITKQQLEIEELKTVLDNQVESMQSIYNILFGVGGLLNDRSIGMTKEQLGLLRQIEYIVTDYLSDDE